MPRQKRKIEVDGGKEEATGVCGNFNSCLEQLYFLRYTANLSMSVYGARKPGAPIQTIHCLQAFCVSYMTVLS